MRMRTCKLPEVATWSRARKGKIYPAGCTCLQISATKGQMMYLWKPQTVDSKYCVIDPDRAVLHPYYFHHCLQALMPKFLYSHQTGLNIVPDILNQFQIRYCTDKRIQEIQAAEMTYYAHETEALQQDIYMLEGLKQYLFSVMFC